LRLKNLMGAFAQANIQSPQQFQEFARANNVTMPEAQALMQLMQQQKKTFAPPTPVAQYGSAGGGAVFNKFTGDVNRPEQPTDYYYVSDSGTVVSRKARNQQEAQKFESEGFKRGSAKPGKATVKDYYKVNNDGSIVQRKARNALDERKLQSSGFEEGTYKSSPSNGSASSKPIKTWVLPEIKADGSRRKPIERLWHAPSDVSPPAGSIPYSEASSMEQRLMTNNELSSIRQDKRQIRSELQRLRVLPDLKAFEQQKSRIPDLEAELKELETREKEVFESGNAFNLRMGTTENKPDEEQPPIKGARKAPDGKWYIESNGQYYRVD
jgi:hypothetical protein